VRGRQRRPLAPPRAICILDDAPQAWVEEDWHLTIAVRPYRVFPSGAASSLSTGLTDPTAYADFLHALVVAGFFSPQHLVCAGATAAAPRATRTRPSSHTHRNGDAAVAFMTHCNCQCSEGFCGAVEGSRPNTTATTRAADTAVASFPPRGVMTMVVLPWQKTTTGMARQRSTNRQGGSSNNSATAFRWRGAPPTTSSPSDQEWAALAARLEGDGVEDDEESSSGGGSSDDRVVRGGVVVEEDCDWRWGDGNCSFRSSRWGGDDVEDVVLP